MKQSDGAVKRGTVYVTLQRMEEKGFVTSHEESETPEHIGIPRRLYKVTSLGALALKMKEKMRAFRAGGMLPQGA